ncbi:hypothetical protein O181_068677 [Austropuccinia psidii MF-1]|uniref:Uncharacterized protein n=1 Tax=Austropuccinia psidii MF-1 TaxID=1389203 RepID=A0A9Q3F2W6_9BASI|nr:hypothetical protein [Austropuccinia psidii MF-1]
MSIPGALAFLIYVDWFNAHGKSIRLASIGPIMLTCLNLPPSERLKSDNVYVSGIIPGSKEPTALQLNYLLAPLIKELKELCSQFPPLTLNIHLVLLALGDHPIKGEALDHLRKIISVTIITSSWTRVPHKMGSTSHCSLKASEWALSYNVYIPFLMLSQQMSLDEHNSPNMQSKMGISEDLESQLTKNEFHLIRAINIATSWTVSMDDASAFVKDWKQLRLSNKHLFPKQESKPNYHFSYHIPELFQFWCPAQASATWGYERLIGVFAKMSEGNKICMLINKRNIFTLTIHMN